MMFNGSSRAIHLAIAGAGIPDSSNLETYTMKVECHMGIAFQLLENRHVAVLVATDYGKDELGYTSK